MLCCECLQSGNTRGSSELARLESGFTALRFCRRSIAAGAFMGQISIIGYACRIRDSLQCCGCVFACNDAWVHARVEKL
jgi:hypothetical protein